MNYIFKTHNDVAFGSIKTNANILDGIDLSDFNVKKVEMKGGGNRIKYTCLVDNISLGFNNIKFYLDKGFYIYQY